MRYKIDPDGIRRLRDNYSQNVMVKTAVGDLFNHIDAQEHEIAILTKALKKMGCTVVPADRKEPAVVINLG